MRVPGTVFATNCDTTQAEPVEATIGVTAVHATPDDGYSSRALDMERGTAPAIRRT